MFLFRQHDKDYKIIAKSKYFDSKWYLKIYTDVADAKKDPIEHYLNNGWKEGRNPSPIFDTNYYISQYMQFANMCPVLHYEKYGKKQGIHILSKPINQPNVPQQVVIYENLPFFSVIIPTYNRANLIIQTIHNILGQQYQNFEIIIIDDGSTDNTKEEIYKHFAPELKSKKLRYFYKKHSGVCKARNYGLAHAKHDWIAYVDSDNLIFPTFLNVFAQNIISNKKQKTFYCAACSFSGNTMGGKFNYDELLKANYIDLGTFVHHKDVYRKLGGFDENMTRLVDWDLIARYTKKYKPIYINEICLLYNDSNTHTRISNNTDLDKNMEYFRKKHCKNN